MNTYKITNITNLAAKRDRKYNSTITIEYVDKMTRKTLMVNAGATVYLTVSSLPLSVHRLRIKNLITVIEVDAAEVSKPIKKSKPKKVSKPRATKKVDTEKKENFLVEKKTQPTKKGRPATKKV